MTRDTNQITAHDSTEEETKMVHSESIDAESHWVLPI